MKASWARKIMAGSSDLVIESEGRRDVSSAEDQQLKGENQWA
jgi:hypothetical protein